MNHNAAYVAALAAALLMCPRLARADWPMPRHDARRTGAAAGASNIATPASYWRYYLGGSIGALGAVPAHVDGDASSDVLFIVGGKLSARRGDDSPLWESSLLGLRTIDAVSDLNGDGSLDVVVEASNRVFIFRLSDGTLEWAEPEGEMGTVGGVRVADFDGDGAHELFIQECGCCGVNSGKTGFAYSFSNGFDSPSILWTLPSVACGGGRSLCVVDIAGDGSLEVTQGTSDDISLLVGMTGAVLGTTPDLGLAIHASRCLPADVDGFAGEELVCVLSEADLYVEPDGGHRVFALSYDAASATPLSVLWDAKAGDLNAEVVAAPGMVEDLDGDGLKEVTIGGKTAGNTAVTQVFDAASGVELASLPGQRLIGTAPLEGPSNWLILTQAGDALAAWLFDRDATPSVVQRWSLPDTSALTFEDPALLSRSPFIHRLATADISGDGVVDLFVRLKTLDGDELLVYSGVGGSAQAIANHDLGAGVGASKAWPLPPGEAARVMLARTDGFITFHDASLLQLGPGVRVGGYYSPGNWGQLIGTPVVADLGNGVASVLATDSKGTLLRLDATTASMASPPTIAWSRERTRGAIVVPDLDAGAPGIVAFGVKQAPNETTSDEVVALTSGGSGVWASGIGGAPRTDLLPAHLDGDGIPDIVAQWVGADTVLRTRAIAGATGAELWTVAPFAAGSQPAGSAIADWDGDGVDDIVLQENGTRVLAGASGSLLQTSPPGIGYAMPIIFDVDMEGTDEVTLQGTYAPARTLAHDLVTELWAGTEDDRPYPYGSVALCEGAPPRLVEGSWQFPSRLKVSDLSGPTAGLASVLVLAGGQSFSDESAAQAAGMRLGQLTSTSLHQDLQGIGAPVAVVGSDDGWLYGVNPCSGELAFALDFKAPVGAIAFGDLDGDQLDEMIVSVADGYLYGVRETWIDAPTSVWDIDPDAGATDADVDVIVTTDSLSGKWAEVDGATSYEVAVALESTGELVTDPQWQDVGLTLTTTLTGLPLEDGSRYVFAVRALAGTLSSSVSESDGVLVIFPEQTTGAGPSTSGGGASTTTTSGAGGADGRGFDEVILNGRACTCGIIGSSRRADGLAALVAIGTAMILCRARRRSRERS